MSTPAEKLGYKIGDAFLLIPGESCSHLDDPEVVFYLIDDDRTSNPWFSVDPNIKRGDKSYNYFALDLSKIKPTCLVKLMELFA
jgi:hypothetical protein